MDVIIEIGKYLIWYYLLAIGIIILTLFASWIHETIKPLFWGLIVGLLMIMLQAYLSPIVFGVLNYEWETQFFEWVLTGWFAVAFFGYIGLCCYNLMKYGEVWQ